MFNIKDRTDEIIHCSTGSKLRRGDCEGVRQCGRKMVLITAAAVGCGTFTGEQSTEQHFRDRPAMSLTSFVRLKKARQPHSWACIQVNLMLLFLSLEDLQRSGSFFKKDEAILSQKLAREPSIIFYGLYLP